MRAGQVTNRSGDQFKPSAIRSYDRVMRLRVLPKLGHLRLREITTQDVQRFIDGLVTAKLAPATIDSTLTALRALYRRAASRGDVKANPTLRIEKPAVRPTRKQVVSPT